MRKNTERLTFSRIEESPTYPNQAKKQKSPLY
jgi:hypothetical protein